MKWFIFVTALFLAACGGEINLLVAEVGPEKKECYDTTRVLGADRYIIQVDTVTCKGPIVVRWK